MVVSYVPGKVYRYHFEMGHSIHGSRILPDIEDLEHYARIEGDLGVIALEEIEAGSAWLVRASFSGLSLHCSDDHLREPACDEKWIPLSEKLGGTSRTFVHNSSGKVTSISSAPDGVHDVVDHFQVHLMRGFDVGFNDDFPGDSKKIRVSEEPSGSLMFRTLYHHADALIHVPFSEHSMRVERKVLKEVRSSGCDADASQLVVERTPLMSISIRQGLIVMPREHARLSGPPPGHFSVLLVTRASAGSSEANPAVQMGPHRSLLSTQALEMRSGHHKFVSHGHRHQHAPKLHLHHRLKRTRALKLARQASSRLRFKRAAATTAQASTSRALVATQGAPPLRMEIAKVAVQIVSVMRTVASLPKKLPDLLSNVETLLKDLEQLGQSVLLSQAKAATESTAEKVAEVMCKAVRAGIMGANQNMNADSEMSVLNAVLNSVEYWMRPLEKVAEVFTG